MIGAERFPHGGFRHFVRYINIRGITPGERGGEKERRSSKLMLGEGVGSVNSVKYKEGAPKNISNVLYMTHRKGKAIKIVST